MEFSFVFDGFVWVLHAFTKRLSKHCIRYYSYMVLKQHVLPVGIALDCGGIIGLGSEKHSLPVEKGLDQQIRDSDEQPRLKHGSRRPLESAGCNLELFMLMQNAMNILKDE